MMKPVKQDEEGRQLALFIYWLLVAVGVPIWWLTTRIERHPLPVRELDALHTRFRSLRLPNNDSIRVKGYPGYQLSFTIVSPDDECPIEQAWLAYKTRFAPSLATVPVAYFKVDFQCRLHADRGRAMEPNSEWNLANSISSLPIINFILVSWDDGADATTVLYPQWGVITKLTSDYGQLMDNLFSHLLLLLGVDQGNLADWFQAESTRCILHALSSLHSLLSVISTTPNMPVPRPVSSAVSAAVAHLRHAATLRDGEEKFGEARNALDAAEAAFYHPAMLARQYFPREHQLAVYVPLFVPLLMPLAVQTIKYRRRNEGI